MMEAEIFLVESQLVSCLLCGIKSDVFLAFWVFPFSSYIGSKTTKITKGTKNLIFKSKKLPQLTNIPSTQRSHRTMKLTLFTTLAFAVAALATANPNTFATATRMGSVEMRTARTSTPTATLAAPEITARAVIGDPVSTGKGDKETKGKDTRVIRSYSGWNYSCSGPDC